MTSCCASPISFHEMNGAPTPTRYLFLCLHPSGSRTCSPFQPQERLSANMQKVNTAGYQTDCFVGEKAVASQLRKRTLCPTVTNFNNGSEASCGSDTKDELHIVEDDSLQEPEVTKADGTTAQDSHDATTTVLPHNGSLNGAVSCFRLAQQQIHCWEWPSTPTGVHKLSPHSSAAAPSV
ncbi:uncharacterized protein LOC123977058 isoform X3 [Micropterus dolomieu]|uniref:uncharacterized protein LOC123977058 isoform X3 n=1 Tax=Micropterus dolomieu TaxID=147949 RepID=UPI001E8E8959|nr:uncharacterized protein LOC123977058 isoform X3 [Micropterus dolomieu]